MVKLKQYFNQHPLRSILFIGFVLRLIAVIFSKGFGMYDDHFCVVEVAQGWVDGVDVRGWLTNSMDEINSGKGFLYPGLHYLLFWLFKAVNINSPDVKMYIVRLIHAIWSLLVIYYGYKITNKISNRKNAITVALLCATFWLFPAMSVKNLVEVVSIPLLMMATWITIKELDSPKKAINFFVIGVLLSLAFSLRYQTALYSAGVVVSLLINRNWKGTFLVIVGALIPFLILHGWLELKLSGVAFGRVQYYIIYNIKFATSYITLPWYNYILLVCGVLIPPMGLLLFIGTFKTWKKHSIIFIGLALFFIFHSYFPNKQERFMLTMIPFFIILGVIGWNEITEKYSFWRKNKWIMKFSWGWFWVLNIALLFLFSTYYSKRSRVESMLYLYSQKDVQGIIVENRLKGGIEELPMFYSGLWDKVYKITKHDTLSKFGDKWKELPAEKRPNYILFVETSKEDIEDRVEDMKQLFPHIKYKSTIEVSFLDGLHAKANPRHINNDRYYIYKIIERGKIIDN